MTAVAESALLTDDVAAAAGFYADVLGVDHVAEWSDAAVFAVGSSKLLVHERSAVLEGGPPNEDHFAFSGVDLDAACAGLRSHGRTFLVEPREYPWSRSAYLRGPDDRLVELSEHPS